MALESERVSVIPPFYPVGLLCATATSLELADVEERPEQECREPADDEADRGGLERRVLHVPDGVRPAGDGADDDDHRGGRVQVEDEHRGDHDRCGEEQGDDRSEQEVRGAPAGLRLARFLVLEVILHAAIVRARATTGKPS